MVIHSPSDLGAMVRTARKRAGLTQRDLADLCACGPRFISELENGKATIELGKAMRVINTLSMDMSIDPRSL